MDLGSETSICLCLCVCVALHGCLAPVSPFFTAWRLVVGVGGLSACVRLRGLCLSTCLGWVSVGHVRALGPGLSRLPAPLLSTVFPLLGSKLFSGFLQQRLLAALLSLTSGGPSSREGKG